MAPDAWWLTAEALLLIGRWVSEGAGFCFCRGGGGGWCSLSSVSLKSSPAGNLCMKLKIGWIQEAVCDWSIFTVQSVSSSRDVWGFRRDHEKASAEEVEEAESPPLIRYSLHKITGRMVSAHFNGRSGSGLGNNYHDHVVLHLLRLREGKPGEVLIPGPEPLTYISSVPFLVWSSKWKLSSIRQRPPPPASFRVRCSALSCRPSTRPCSTTDWVKSSPEAQPLRAVTAAPPQHLLQSRPCPRELYPNTLETLSSFCYLN